MATITVDTYLDGGVARTAGEAFAIGSGAKFTIRTDSRLHANAPASMLGSLGNPTFTDIGGEHIIDGTDVRWLAYSSGSGNVPAIGTSISQGAVTGYFLGAWASLSAAPTPSGSALPASGFLKFREVTGGSFAAGALTGISASADSADVTGWIEVAYDSGSNFVVPRVGKFTVRGDWFYLGTTNGSVGQQFQVPSTSSKCGYNYAPGAWVETGVGTDQYEFWPALNGVANGWGYRFIGYPEGYTDKRGQFMRNLFGDGKLQIGETYSLKGTYASVAAQASTYVGVTVAGTYTWANDILSFDGGANAHYLEAGMQCGFDFTSGSATDQILTITKVIDAYKFECALTGSGTGGNVTLRPGVTITFTAHGLNIGNDVGCDFTSGTGVDGIYKVYTVDSANAYKVNYPHLAALTSGNVSCLHTLRFTVPSAINITDVALTGTYTLASNIVTATVTGHQLIQGMPIGVDFTSGTGVTDGTFYVLEVIDANTFTFQYVLANTSGNLTIRPGVIVALTAHEKNIGEGQYYNFAATVTDGDYPVYAVDSADQYKINVPHLTAYTATTAALEHGLAVGNEVYLDFRAGDATDGKFTIRAVAATTFDVNYGHLAAITSSAAYVKMTEGYIPPSGCKVRIPNVLMSEVATGLRSLNTAPNATIATRPEFTTTSAGALDIEYLYGLSNYLGAIGQAYQCRLNNTATHDSVNLSEIATGLDIDGLGIGMYSAQDMRALQLTSCFAGGTVKNVVAMRGNTPGTTDHSLEAIYCIGQTLENIRTGIIQYARSTGAVNISTSQNLTIKSLKQLNANMLMPSCVNILIEDLDHCDRIIGKTNTGSMYALLLSGASNGIVLDGFTCGLNETIPDVHPLAGVVSYTGCLNLKFRNIGTYSNPLHTGNWEITVYAMLTPFVSGGNNSNVKIQKCYFERLKVSLVTTINSDKGITFEHLDCFPYYHGSGTGNPKGVMTLAQASLNGNTKAVRTGIFPTSGQTSVYGTIWFDLFRGGNHGAIILAMNEPTTETSNQVSITSGVVKFNSAGGVEMRAIGAQAIWETPYFIQGHTAFKNQAAIMSGGTIGNYTLEYQIDTGSGYSAWKTLNGTNLSGETISPTTGFKLKIRITTSTTNTAAITFLRLETVSTESAQAAISYPLDTASLTLTGLVAGTEIHAYLGTNPDTVTELAATENSGTSFTFEHAAGGNSGYITLIKPGYRWLTIPLTYSSSNTEIPVFQSVDLGYNNPA